MEFLSYQGSIVSQEYQHWDIFGIKLTMSHDPVTNYLQVFLRLIFGEFFLQAQDFILGYTQHQKVAEENHKNRESFFVFHYLSLSLTEFPNGLK